MLHHSRALRRFILIGTAGFLVDATILTLLTRFASWQPWTARVPSFLFAVLVTWLLNRRFTFADRRLHRRLTEALLYAAIQTLGALINLAVFGVCLYVFRELRHIPVVALAIGSLSALAFNFTIMNFVLYARPNAEP